MSLGELCCHECHRLSREHGRALHRVSGPGWVGGSRQASTAPHTTQPQRDQAAEPHQAAAQLVLPAPAAEVAVQCAVT